MAPLNHFQVVTPRGTQMPFDRNAHRVFADDNYLYLLGGFSPYPSRTWSEAWRFNRLTQTWQQCTLADPASPLPDTLAGFSLVCRGPGPDFNCGSNEAFIFGGTKLPLGEQSSTNAFYWIKIDKAGRVHLKLQTVLGDKPLPAHHGQGMCRRLEMNQGRLQEVVYIVGGTTGPGRHNMDVWKLQRLVGADLDQSWDATRLNRYNPDMLGRHHLDVVPHDDKLYTFGGIISGRNYGTLDELTIFDLKSNEFEQLQTEPDPVHGFPRKRFWQTMVHRRNMMYLLGGRRHQELAIFDTVWRFDLDSLEWTQLPTGLPPVFLSSAAISPDGCIFVSGGITKCEWPRQPIEDRGVHSLQRMWLLPPSLVHFAADQLLKGLSEGLLNELTEEGVRLADVPQFVSRILCPPHQHQDEKNNAAAATPPPTHALAAAAPGQATAEQKKPSLFSTFLDWICCRPRGCYYC